MASPTTLNVERFMLDNGLTVLIKENHASPVAAVLAYVNVGYFNEPDRWNGLAHVVEHMFFKGTKKRPGKEEIAEEVRAIGGNINAGTYYEETSYYIVAPSENVEKAIELQADTFVGSLFDAGELAKELEVIIQESKQKRDNPGAMALESMYALSYDVHRIRRWRIGPDEVLRALRHEDLVEFVQQTYRPENIVLAVVGDVDPATVRKAVERWWGELPKGELRKEQSPPEPEHVGFRYQRMRGDIQQRLFEIGFPAPDVLHPDTPALMTLGAVLSDGRSSRLYRALKEEQGLVNSVWAGYEGFERLGVFTMGAETVGDDPLASEQALFAEVGKMVEGAISEEELRRVKTRMESRRLYMQEEVLGVARTLAEYQALGDYRLADEMLARLKAVTADDVRRVAAHYIRPEHATLLEYLPNSADVPERTAEQVEGAIAQGDASRKRVEAQVVAVPGPGSALPEVLALPNGATLLHRQRTDLPIVAISVLFPGGKCAEDARTSGMTSLMLKSALKGTESFMAAEIAERIESLGSSIGTPLGPDYFGFSIKVMNERVREALEVLKEVIARPVFPVEEVEKEKQTIYGEIRHQRDSMFAHAYDLFNRSCYGDQPYGLPSGGIEEAVAAITAADLRAWHGRWVRGGGAVIGVVGDIGTDEISDLLADAVPPGEQVAGAGGVKYLQPGEAVDRVERQQTAAVMGFPGATMEEDERHALDVISEITSGLAGRFFQAVRGENALAYAVTSFSRARRDSGNFITYTATSPENEERAREILLEECEKLAREPVGGKELADAKEAIRGDHAISIQTFGAQAAEMTTLHLYGLPLDAAERYLARIDAVTPEEMMAVAGKYLKRDQIWLGVVRGGASKE